MTCGFLNNIGRLWQLGALFDGASAFTQFTGKDHWEVLLRARAVENTAWVIAQPLGPTWSVRLAMVMI